MTQLFKNIRFHILVISFISSLLIFIITTTTIPEGALQLIRLGQVYALVSIFLLYITLLAGPLCFAIPSIPFRGAYIKGRRALGVSAFYFALLHACIAFFEQLGGFSGLSFLGSSYLISLILGFLALFIMFLLALTSSEYMIVKLTYPKWKFLHRFVYLAGLFTVIHAFMLGTHFTDLFTLIPQLFFFGLFFLLFLEARRVDSFLGKWIPAFPRFRIITTAYIAFVLLLIVFSFLSFQNGTISLNIHADQIKLMR